jgi:predicted negative regulator of RcsB-dependent stress response
MYDLEEQEQIDALKAWWRQHGRLLIAAVVAAVVAAGAVSAWRYYKDGQAAKASQLYATLEKAVRANDVKQVKELADQLTDKYAGTPYGPMAALAAAKADFDAGDLASAGRRLQWAAEHTRDDEVRAIAQLRLAGVRLDEKKYDEALKLLDGKHPDSFAGLYADLRGDALLALGKGAEAKAAYKLALEKLPAQSNYRLLVQLKLDGLGGGGK